MPTSLYYVVYDIPSNRLRSRVATALKNAGLERVQYSVFLGPLNKQRKKDLQETLKNIIQGNGSIYFIPTCEACFGKLSVIGRGFDVDYVTGAKRVVIV
ncbi:MAG: CRISPR-associated endonuclease Cas2 [Candidatus Micrarchaeia archaeon]